MILIKKMNVLFCVFWCTLWLSTSAYNSSIIELVGNGVQHLTFLSHKSQYNIVKNKWFEQELDHFNITDTRTWKQVLLYYRFFNCILW